MSDVSSDSDGDDEETILPIEMNDLIHPTDLGEQFLTPLLGEEDANTLPKHIDVTDFIEMRTVEGSTSNKDGTSPKTLDDGFVDDVTFSYSIFPYLHFLTLLTRTLIFRTCIFHPCIAVLEFSILVFSTHTHFATLYFTFPYLRFPVLAISAPPCGVRRCRCPRRCRRRHRRRL